MDCEPVDGNSLDRESVDGDSVDCKQVDRVAVDRFTVDGLALDFEQVDSGGLAGAGLGLSMTFGYVRQSNGYLVIDSVPKKGTSIVIYLPRYQGETA